MRRQFPLWTGLLSGWLAVIAAAMPLLADDPVFLRVTSVETSTPEAAARVADVEPGESSGCEAACTCEPVVGGNVGRAWARVEYLLWWTRGNRLPPLLTTSPDGTDRDLAGVLGQDETQLLFGDTSAHEGARSGGRLRLGYDLGECSPYGMEFDLLDLGDGAGTSWATGLSTGSPILARPIINAQTGLEDAQLAAYPELVDGRLNVTASSELYAAAALLRQAWYHRRCVRSNLVGGYRFFHFREGLGLEENLISRDEGGLVEIGTRIDVFDRFSAKNTFHGGELGLDMAWEKGPLSLELLATVALGNVHQVVEIRGLTRVRTPGDPATERTGGLLALPSNMGAISRDEFAALPQLGANLRWQVSDHLELTCGYQWFLLTSTVQTGDQIDRTVDPSQLSPLLNVPGNPAPAERPANPFHQTAFWAHGVNAGLQFSY